MSSPDPNLSSLTPGTNPLSFLTSVDDSSDSLTVSTTGKQSTQNQALVAADQLDTIAASTAAPTETLQLLGPSGNPLLLSPSSHPDMLAYANAISDAVNAAQSEDRQNEILDYLLTSGYTQEAANAAHAMISLYVNIVEYATITRNVDNQGNADINAVNGDAAQVNATILSGRTQDTAAVDAYNQAVQDYNNGTITQAQFNQAVQTYNAYIATRNPALAQSETAYNNDVTAYNDALPALNQQIAQANIVATELGLPTVPLLQPISPISIQLPAATASPPAQIPVSQVQLPPGSVASIPNLPAPTSQQDLLTTFYTPVATLTATNVQNMLNQLALNANYLQTVWYFLTGTVPNVSPAYIDKNPVTFNGANAVASQGSSLSGMMLGSQPVGVQRVLSNGNYAIDTLKNSYFLLNPRQFAALTYNAVNLLGNVGLFSALPATNLLAEKLGDIPPESPVVGASVGFGFLQVLNGSISSDAFKNDLEGFLVSSLSDSGLSEQEIINTAKVLVPITTIALLQIGLVQASLSLNAPGLTSQVLANLSNLPENAVQLSSSSQGTLTSDVLQNAQARALISQAVATNSQSQIDENSVNQALANVANNPDADLNNPSTLSSAISQAFQEQGLSSQQSEILSQLAIAEISGSANLPFLASELGNGTASNLPIATLSAGLSGGQNSTVVAAAIGQSINKSQNTVDFQQELTNQLTQAGINNPTASTLARNLTLGLASESFSAAVQNNALNTTLLQNSLAQSLNGQLSSEQLQNIINQALQQSNLNSVADLRQALNQQLQENGINATYAATASNSAIVDLDNSGQDPLKALGLSQVLGIPALAQRLHAHITGTVSTDIGSQAAQKLAANYSLALLGVSTDAELAQKQESQPASSFSMLNDALQDLQNLGQTQLVKQWASSLRDLTNPTLDLTHFLSQIKEPATVLLSTAIPGLGMQQVKRPIDSLNV